MDDREICEWVVKAFKPMLKTATNKARSGDNQAAEDVMKLMTAETWVLRKFDLMVDDDGNIVPFIPWEPPSSMVEYLKQVDEGIL